MTAPSWPTPTSVGMVRRTEGDEEEIAFCTRSSTGRLWWLFADDAGGRVEDVHSARPLVTLDLAEGYRAGWPALIGALRTAKEATGLPITFDSLISQIEAQTAPPRPAEPTGLGVRVVDRGGLEWALRTGLHPAPDGMGMTERRWGCLNGRESDRTWDELLDTRGPVTIEGGE